MIVLGTSLSDTKDLLDQNEEDHILEIEGLVSSYERKSKIQKILLWVLVGIVVGETTYIIVDNLVN